MFYEDVKQEWVSQGNAIAKFADRGCIATATEARTELLLHQLSNKGELIIKWDRKIKNEGNSVNAS
jgi:hypothetical protein